MPRRIITVIAAGIILTAGIIFIVTCIEMQPNNAEAAPANTEEEEIQQQEPEPSRAEIIMSTLAAAYPWRIEKAEARNDDWAILMGGVWYYYAGGRMLPENLLERANEYTGSFSIPGYQKDLPPWTDPTPEQNARNRERNTSASPNTNTGNNTPQVQRQRSYFFQENLWQSGTRNESSQMVITIEFLKRSLVVHRDIEGVLSLVEKRIMEAAETDTEVASWITNIGEMTCWNWRNVAGSQSRSNHSYGIAVDILPKSLGGKETYWQWARDRGLEYWAIPYERRYHPPDKVVKAFEAYGFTWGGKWQNFDTMHFEYRPEVFLLSGLDVIIP